MIIEKNLAGVGKTTAAYDIFTQLWNENKSEIERIINRFLGL